MPTTMPKTPSAAASPAGPARKVWTRSDCEHLERTGFPNYEHLELVEGELINRMGKKRPHVNAQGYVLKWAFGDEFVNSEAPIDVSPEDNPTSEPVPDLIVLNKPTCQVSAENALPGDLRLVIEVSDTTLRHDLTQKAGLYARVGIVEYWVLDVTDRRPFVHREPLAGKYQSITEYAEHESVAPLAAPDAAFLVSSAFSAPLP